MSEQEEGDATAAEETTAVAQKEEEKKYPIDVPSPILLASAMVLAISAVGTFVPFNRTWRNVDT